ncbi:MAG: ATP-dependent chaperone ClpB, partial [Acholeplasmataceae bacterium]
NIGSQLLLSTDKEKENQVLDLVKKHFKPEFINRLDEIIIFNPLSFKVQVLIVEKMLIDLDKRLKEKNILIKMDEEVQKYVIKYGYQEEYGARPLKRFIQRNIETLIATKMIAGEIIPNRQYLMTIKNDVVKIIEQRKTGLA